jgi:hypothetical protein
MKKLYPLLFVLFLIYWGCEEEQDTIPPTVSIQSPITNQSINEIVTILVETNDNEGINRVEFYIDDSLFFTDSESPYQYDWNTTQYEDNSEHIVKVISYDNSDNSTTSQPIVYVIDNSTSVPNGGNIISVTYTITEMTVEWEESTDGDFKDYKVLYSDTENGDIDTLETYTDKSTTSHIITDFDPTHENWFWVQVSDTMRLSSIGTGMTNDIETPPTPSELYPIVYEDGSFVISWSQNNDYDFSSYTLYQSENTDMSNKIEVFVSNNIEDTTTSINIDAELNLYYRVEVRDSFGLTSDSWIQTGSTMNIADMMVYAVSNDGDLLWKNYLHGGIWDLGSSVTPLSDGGYMVYGLFDAVNSSGCCYNPKWDTGDIIKLNSQGQEEWRKEINFGDGSPVEVWHNYIGKSLIETSNGDLVFIAPISARGINIVMMDSDGNLIWSQNYSDLYFWNYNGEIMETEDGDLAVVAGSPTRIRILDYYSGEILTENEYQGLAYPRAIIDVGGDFAILGNALYGNDDYEPIYLLKVSNDGDEIWRKIWSDDTIKPRTALDLILTSDDGYLLFCYSDPYPYATLIKTDSEGNEQWRKKYNDYVGGSQGWIHETDDGGYFMASGYAVTKLDQYGDVEWSAAPGSAGFHKNFNNGMVSGINHDMKQIQGGAVMVGYGSASWE